MDQRRLKGSDLPLRYRVDTINLRNPGQAGARYHQDSAEHGSDRGGELQFWLALAEVTPEMGAMRFFNRSHREGLLGAVLNDDLDSDGEPASDLLDQYPNLPRVLGLSAPLHYQPGDVTVHHGSCVHGSPANTSERQRWSYLFSYTPEDTRYGEGSGRTHLPDESHPVLNPRL
jgi:ectoine hydroxylase-related dioxygenase (phytanoyl-CoA dioxygenase family)